jgi:hypothetical protein
MKLYAVGTVNKEGTTWSTIEAKSKREAAKVVKHLGGIVRVAEVKKEI